MNNPLLTILATILGLTFGPTIFAETHTYTNNTDQPVTIRVQTDVFTLIDDFLVTTEYDNDGNVTSNTFGDNQSSSDNESDSYYTVNPNDTLTFEDHIDTYFVDSFGGDYSHFWQEDINTSIWTTYSIQEMD